MHPLRATLLLLPLSVVACGSGDEIIMGDRPGAAGAGQAGSAGRAGAGLAGTAGHAGVGAGQGGAGASGNGGKNPAGQGGSGQGGAGAAQGGAGSGGATAGSGGAAASGGSGAGGGTSAGGAGSGGAGGGAGGGASAGNDGGAGSGGAQAGGAGAGGDGGGAGEGGAGAAQGGAGAGGEAGAGGAGVVCAGGGLGVLDSPAMVSLDALNPTSAYGDLVQTASGYVWLHSPTQPGSTIPITLLSSTGEKTATLSVDVKASQPAYTHAVPGCGGVVAVGTGLAVNSPNPSFMAVIASDGSATVSNSLGSVGGIDSRPTPLGADGVLVSARSRVMSVNCSGALEWEVPLEKLRPGVACDWTCLVSRCVSDGAGQIGCVSVDLGQFQQEVRRSIVTLDTSGAVVTAPTGLMPGLDGNTSEISSCGPGCFDVLIFLASGAYMQRMKGGIVEAPRELKTDTTLFGAVAWRVPGVLFLFGNNNALYAFDAATLAPYNPDVLGHGTPIVAPENGCKNRNFLAAAPSMGGVAMFIDSTPFNDCLQAKEQRALFIGCK